MSISFLKTGAAAVKEEIDRADAEQAAAFGPRRFWLEKGKEARITFLDGGLEGGLLSAVSFYEHMVRRSGGKAGFDNYPCTQETEACPICEDGDTPSLVFALTVIDHREWKDKGGKVHKFEKRMFVCKRETFKRLQAKATKLMEPTELMGAEKGPPKAINGLIGVTFEVTRIGDKSASVGSDFDFVACTPLEQIYAACGYKDPGTGKDGDGIPEKGPYVYGDVIKYYPAPELRKMGFGVNKGSSVGSADTKAAAETTGASNGKAAVSSPFGSPFNPSKEL